MSQESRARSRNHASYMKAHKIERTTAACPWHCGASVKIGGEALLSHLTRCTGNPRKRSKDDGMQNMRRTRS